jgi:mannosyltransferase OCH1-like enzyme
MSLIPKVIYQSWSSKDLEPALSLNVQNTKALNPEYEYRFYDDRDCRGFLLEHFGLNYANAFDALIPGAFKCDFWRYAVLYVNGGVYLDMDIKPLYPFREILNSTDTFVSVADQENGLDMTKGIYQAFIASVPRHPILLYALQIAYVNIATRRISVNSLDITGPTVMGVAFNLYFNNEQTYTKISSKDYGDGIRLFRMTRKNTFDLGDRVIFNNKCDGYSRGSKDYGLSIHFYKDSPWGKSSVINSVIARFSEFLPHLFLILLLIAIIVVIHIKTKK